MYIDFHKYNYDLVPKKDRNEYLKRDKEAYKKIFQKWVSDNIDTITERKWEIEEIGFLTEISDFIKLIREAETLYELGFYTSCTALVGVSAEDFSKYISLKLGKLAHIETTTKGGKVREMVQKDRIDLQLSEAIITQNQYELLNNIRLIRNDCLHYNNNFKSKTDSDLKADSLLCLNSLKSLLKDILGISNAGKDLTEIISDLAGNQGIDTKNPEEMKTKIRNAMSHLFDFPIAFDPKQKHVIKDGYYLVEEIDFDFNEITLKPVFSPAYVIVELNESVKEIITKQNIKEKHTVKAILFSVVSEIGMTEEWNFIELSKVDNFSEIFHDMINEAWGTENEEE